MYALTLLTLLSAAEHAGSADAGQLRATSRYPVTHTQLARPLLPLLLSHQSNAFQVARPAQAPAPALPRASTARVLMSVDPPGDGGLWWTTDVDARPEELRPRRAARLLRSLSSAFDALVGARERDPSRQVYASVDTLTAGLDDGLEDGVEMGEEVEQLEEVPWNLGTQVYTDVDDTVKSSGGGRFLGVDTRYPKGTLYPGVTAFLRAVSSGPLMKPPRKVVVTTARPDNSLFRISPDSKVANAFDKQAGADWGLALEHTLYGRKRDFRHYVKNRVDMYVALAKHKVRNVRAKQEELGYPEAVFVGDNGQGDLRTARALLEQGDIAAAFIHDVKGYLAPEEGYLVKSRGIGSLVFFRTYAHAAAAAVEIGAMPPEAYEDVLTDILSSTIVEECKAEGELDDIAAVRCRDLATAYGPNWTIPPPPTPLVLQQPLDATKPRS